ncbi:MAG: NrfD/PsrC family molybdoenzyme membrane anchor subunit [Natrialbaceae archaeon]|nr:NrfD/PsrC family molybdoenzyme membrane anchor subunit [Natrialbaceae archaeon]
MSTEKISTDDLLRPINWTSRRWFIMVALGVILTGIWMAAWSYQLYHGLIVTNLSDWGTGGGSTWGLYIGAFIWWVGIAHGGIILSAAVRLVGLDLYKPVARLAELLTLGALSMAGMYIVVHVGRPDRIVTSIIPAYITTVQTSPLIWDVTVITLYFVMTATYLGLTLRYDISRMRDDLPDIFSPIYSLLTIGYSEKEDEVVERMVWWLALAVIVLAPLLLHGGVIPWLFALIPTMPGWFGAVQGPQFLTIALTSAIAGVIILAYAFRFAYDWDHIFTNEVFRGLTLWLGLFTLLFLWLQLQQVLGGVYAPSLDKLHATEAKLHNPAYIIAISTAVLVLSYIFAQAVRKSVFSLERSLIASFAILGATLTEKTLFVIEGPLHPTFDIYRAVPGTYVPSPIEIMSLVGTVAMAALFFLFIAKVIPVVELHVAEESQHEAAETEVDA